MNKKFLIMSALISLVIPAVLVFGKETLNKTGSKADQSSYTLVYDKDHTVVDAQIKTTSGATIWTKANDGVTFTSNGMEFVKNGYVQNLSALNGITSLTINVTSGSYIVSHGFIEPSDLASPQYVDGEISSTQTFTWSGDYLPSRFRVVAKETGVISSISVKYSCNPSGSDPYEETYEEGFENFKWANSWKKGKFEYDTEVKCPGDFAVSKRSVKFTNPEKNESVSIFNLDGARNKGYSVDTTAEYAIVDIKTNNPDCAGGKSNAVMFSANVKSGQTISGWQDPDGYFELVDNPGWYRFYWKIDDETGTQYSLDNLNCINVIFTQSNGNDIWWFDNAHIGLRPTKLHKLENDSADMQSVNRFVITGDELFSVNLKITSGTLGICFGNWTNYFGTLRLNSDLTNADEGSGYYTGIGVKEIGNGWYKMTISARSLGRTNNEWHNWDYTTNNEMKLVIIRNPQEVTGYFTEPSLIGTGFDETMVKNQTYKPSGVAIDLTVTPRFYIDYNIIGGTKDSFSFMVFNTSSWRIYSGYFQYNSKGKSTGAENAGVTVTSLGSGTFRITFDFTIVTKRTENECTLEEIRSMTVNAIYTHGSWGGDTVVAVRKPVTITD